MKPLNFFILFSQSHITRVESFQVFIRKDRKELSKLLGLQLSNSQSLSYTTDTHVPRAMHLLWQTFYPHVTYSHTQDRIFCKFQFAWQQAGQEWKCCRSWYEAAKMIQGTVIRQHWSSLLQWAVLQSTASSFSLLPTAELLCKASQMVGHSPEMGFDGIASYWLRNLHSTQRKITVTVLQWKPKQATYCNCPTCFCCSVPSLC